MVTFPEKACQNARATLQKTQVSELTVLNAVKVKVKTYNAHVSRTH